MAPLDTEGLTICSTNLYQRVNVPTSGNRWIGRMARASGLVALQGYLAHKKTVVQVIRASADAARSAVAQIADKAAATEVKFAKLDEFCRKRVCI